MTPSSTFRDGCDFCAIARGLDDAAEIVCETSDWIAFFPLNPATPGHTLIIPRMHVTNFWELRPELAGELSVAALRVGQAINEAIKPEGMNLITSAGEVAEQSVFHLHLHVVPRWHRDGFGDIWPHGHRFEDADLDDVATKIRAACEADPGQDRQ